MAKKVIAKPKAKAKPKTVRMTKKRVFEYYINLDERGDFYADVRTKSGKTVMEIKGFDIFEDGFMQNKKDMRGLKEYLVSLKIMNDIDILQYIG